MSPSFLIKILMKNNGDISLIMYILTYFIVIFLLIS